MAKRKYPDNPYLAARYEWNERYGSYMRAASAWRTVGLLAGMIKLGLGGSSFTKDFAVRYLV